MGNRIRRLAAHCLAAIITAGAALVGTGAAPAVHADPTTTFVVTNTNNDGPGSLRQAVIDANADPDHNTIVFDQSLRGATITLTGPDNLVFTRSATLAGPGAEHMTIVGNGTKSVIAGLGSPNPVELEISGLTITGGRGLVSSDSGGIYLNNPQGVYSVHDVVLTGNVGSYGGGLSLYSGTLNLTDSRVYDNHAGNGGGVATATSAVIERTEIVGNVADDLGGGVFLNSKDLTIRNSTIAGNTAGVGGAVHKLGIADTTVLRIEHSTIVGNVGTNMVDALVSGGISGLLGSSDVSMTHTIVAGNTSASGNHDDLSMNVDAEWSIVGASSADRVVDGYMNQIGVDPMLEVVKFNGGIGRSYWPAAGSPAIDAGDPAVVFDDTEFDQRGARRVARSVASAPERIDIGAVEIAPGPDTYDTFEDTKLSVPGPGVLSSDNRGFQAQLVSEVSHGKLTFSPLGGFDYTPARNWHGTDSFTYRLTGPNAPSYTAEVTIRVLPVADVFTLNDDEITVVNTGVAITLPVLANDEYDQIVIDSVDDGTLGTTTTDGQSVTYTPNSAAAVGWDTFEYYAHDGAESSSATVRVLLVAPDVDDDDDTDDPAAPDTFVGVTPGRLLDTRAGEPTVDGRDSGQGKVRAGQTVELNVTGRAGIPADAAAVVLNVTVTEAEGAGYVSVTPCSDSDRVSSSVNFTAGATVANAVIVKLSPKGTVCLRAAGADVQLVADITGFFPAASSFEGLDPSRLLDTRADHPTIDDRQAGTGPVAAGQTVELQVAGRAGIPADAVAVALNVTVTEGDGPGHITVTPCGETGRISSSVNYTAGATVPNAVVVRLSELGTVCLTAAVSGAHLVADVTGFFPAGSGFEGLEPGRLLDTRADHPTIDGANSGAGKVAAGEQFEVLVAGRAGIPADAESVVLNVTATEGDGPGYITVTPCGSASVSSSVNYTTGATVPNAVVVKLSERGTVCAAVGVSATHVVMDVTGYFPASQPG